MKAFSKETLHYYRQYILSIISFFPKLKQIQLYKPIIDEKKLFKNNNNFNICLKQKVYLDLSYKNTPFYKLLDKYKKKITMNNLEDDTINILIMEKNLDEANRNIIELIKAIEIYDFKINLIARKKLAKFIIDNIGNFSLNTLFYFFSKKINRLIMVNPKIFNLELAKNINLKYSKLKLEPKSIVNKFYENLIDNALLFYLIEHLKLFGKEDNWKFFEEVLLRRIDKLNLEETLSIAIFILESRIIDKKIFDHIYYNLQELATEEYAYDELLSEQQIQQIDEKINLFKLLLEFNSIQIDHKIGTYLLNYSLINFKKFSQQKIIVNGNNQNDNNKNVFELLSGDNKDKFDNYLSLKKFKIDANQYLLNSCKNNFIFNINDSYNFTEERLEKYINLLKGKNMNFMQKFFMKKNPFDIFYLINAIAKNPELIKNIDLRELSSIMSLVLRSFFSINNNNYMPYKLSLCLNLQLLQNLNIFSKQAKEKNINFRKIISSLSLICFKKLTEDYRYLKNYYEEKENLKISPFDKKEIIDIFKLISKYFINVYVENPNDTYFYSFNNIILKDLIIFSERGILNKQDLKMILQLYQDKAILHSEFKYLLDN